MIDDPTARALAAQLDPRRNPWMTAVVGHPDTVFVRAEGDALIGLSPDGTVRIADPSAPDGAARLGRTTAALELHEVTGPTGAVAAFIEAREEARREVRGDASRWSQTFALIEMSHEEPARERPVAGELRRAAPDGPWSPWRDAFTAEAFPDGGTPPPVPLDRLWAWYEAGEPRAMAGALPLGTSVIRIVTVYTPAEHRGRGYAGALICRLVRELAHAAPYITLNVVAANTPAIRAYERAGFRPVSHRETWRRRPDP